MAESSAVNVQVLSNALSLFTNAIQAATTPNRASAESRQTIGGPHVIVNTSPATSV